MCSGLQTNLEQHIQDLMFSLFSCGLDLVDLSLFTPLSFGTDCLLRATEFLKYLCFYSIHLFCVRVCMCTMCVQCLNSEDGVRSPRTEVTDVSHHVCAEN